MTVWKWRILILLALVLREFIDDCSLKMKSEILFAGKNICVFRDEFLILLVLVLVERSHVFEDEFLDLSNIRSNRIRRRWKQEDILWIHFACGFNRIDRLLRFDSNKSFSHENHNRLSHLRLLSNLLSHVALILCVACKHPLNRFYIHMFCRTQISKITSITTSINKSTTMSMYLCKGEKVKKREEDKHDEIDYLQQRAGN